MILSNQPIPGSTYELVGDIVRIFQRGGKWYANYQFNGQQQRRSLKTTSKKEARRRAIQLEADLVTGRYERPVKAPPVDKLIEAYNAHQRVEGRAKKTRAKVELVGRRVLDLAARRKAKSILDVNLAFVDQYRSERTDKGAAPKTLQNETVIIRQFINFAIRRRMMTDDPLHGLEIKKVKSSGQPCWSPTEVEAILAAIAGPYQDAFLLWADTGMRFGEAAWLTWDDVDLVNNIICIQAKEDWKPKNGEERAIPMSPRVREMLARRPHRFRWVFTMAPSVKYPAGDHQLQESRLLAYLKVRLERLDLQGKIHTFRHSFVSRSLLAGIPEAVVRRWVGHLDREVTKIYTHILSPDSQAAMQRLSELPNSSTNGKEVPAKQQSA